MVQTAQLHVDEAGVAETVFTPPRLTLSCSAAHLLTGILNVFEMLFCQGLTIVAWIRSTRFPVSTLLIILACDRASGNVLAIKLLCCLQYLALPRIPLLIWVEYCGLHGGERCLIHLMERYWVQAIHR